jgi:hypothetical protein
MTREIEVCIIMDESGDYVVAADEDSVAQLADAELNEDELHRFITLKIKLAPPKAGEVASRTFEIALD